MSLGAGWLLGGTWLLAAAAVSAQPSLADCDARESARVLKAAPADAVQDARAVWLDQRVLRWPRPDTQGRFRLYHSAQGQVVARVGQRVSGADAAVDLQRLHEAASVAEPLRFGHVPSGVLLTLPADAAERVDALLRGQLLLVHEDAEGRVRDATTVQIAGALDDRYAAAEAVEMGVMPRNGRTTFRLWAPTAQQVALCLYPDGRSAASERVFMQRDDATGIWQAALDGDRSGSYYNFLVDVHVAGQGLVRNRVTDPYSVSLTTDSTRSFVADLDDPALQPPGWRDPPRPPALAAPVDQVIYELHLRDFSAHDASVPASLRGKYLAFTHSDSAGMRELRALAQAGITDVHLLPVFDFASVPEQGCVTPAVAGTAADAAPQAVIGAVRERDCYNWGYDPLHYGAPEGSYATDPADGAVRIREFRAMVLALHAAGLRMGMDVVYNHTHAAGQHPQSVLDRIVPGYYQRLNGRGEVETSTCCKNTATEQRMMAKLMIDTAVRWVRDYRIDSFRFDLMGHQPRAVMERLQRAVDEAAGRRIHLLGEGWNFGEVMNGSRFVQAAQGALNGSGITTFSDRARDAWRGGGCCDGGVELISRQGYMNGQGYARNAAAGEHSNREALLRTADLVRVGLAGSLRDYPLRTHRDDILPLQRLAYAGQPAGYVSEPFEVVNYVENHDNLTLFDANVLKLPRATSSAERARVQLLGLAAVAFSQGIAYFHAGGERLRSKSLDRNSYDSGDWFNAIDWRGQDNGFARGLPPAEGNGRDWPLLRPFLTDTRIRPGAVDIAWTRDAFLDLLRVRASSTLFRLRRAADVRERLRLLNTGSAQQPGLVVGLIDGAGYPGANFGAVLYAINVDIGDARLRLPEAAGYRWRLHSALRTDDRIRDGAALDGAGRLQIPARSAVVFVAAEK